jgi:SAM-dependent methyltransferase
MKAIAYELMADCEESYWWYRARRQILCDMVGRLPRGSDIIDFGAGAGGTATLLSQRGYRVVAADVSEAALGACRMRGLATVDLKKERLPERSADCVLAGDVLEHVGDDLALLISLRRSLRPGGVLVATVPAYEFLWSGEDYVSEHVRRYTRAGLKRQIRRAGFDTVWCSYFNTLLLPVIVAVIVTNRLFRPREMYRSNVRPLRKWQNDVLYRLFVSERHLLRWLSFPAGASLLAVARCVEGERTVAGCSKQEGLSDA